MVGDARDLGVPGALVAVPATIEDRWVEKGKMRHYTVAIATTGTCTPTNFQLTSSAPWITGLVAGTFAPKVFRLDIAVDAVGRPPGVVQETLTVAVPSGSCRPMPVRVTLNLRIVDLKQVHVGPRAATCPHEIMPGTTTKACDYTGSSGLREAIDATTGAVHIILHDDQGATATYQGDRDLKGKTWISAAETSDLSHVVIRQGTTQDNKGGVFRLVEDDIHLSNLTLVCDPGVYIAVSAWPSRDASAREATGHHLIENIRFRAIGPERMGYNSIEGPLLLGSDTTVRNCRFEGAFETKLQLRGAQRTRLIQNTFVTYQDYKCAIEVGDTKDVVIANNVLISQTSIRPELLIADAKTDHLIVVGNVVEGAKILISGLPATGNHVVQDNVVGHADLESPLIPRFLATSSQSASALVPGEGTSLDGLTLIGGPHWVPGAFQKRSALTIRRTVIRVGRGTCGAHACDIDASAKNEIQQAVWSVWRGGVVEVYPSATPYAGSAVISWSLTLRGMGSKADDVVLRNADELLVPASYDLWWHDAVLTVHYHQDKGVTIENLTVDARTDTSSRVTRAVIVEAYPQSGRTTDHVLRRLRIVSNSGSGGLTDALLVGDRTRIQDVLVQGPFGTCITFGLRQGMIHDNPTPESKTRVINLTCRLTGKGSYAPRAAFDVASVKDTLLANVALDLETPAPLFRAQRRSVGDTAAKALDLPKSFKFVNATIRGVTSTYDGFASTDGSYTLTEVHVLPTPSTFFVSATDSHLATGAHAIDTGVDPVTLDSTLHAGTSLDGVSRQGRKIDQGAYEQGQ